MGAREIARSCGLARCRYVTKIGIVRRYGGDPRSHLGYVLLDPELGNFTYDIENRDELRAWLDVVCGGGRFVAELDGDVRLRADLDRRSRARPAAKRHLHLGRRLGWYALVRAFQPDVVVETGTHDGLGSVALLAALEANGHGRLISIDPRGGTGWLVPPRLRSRLEAVRAPSQEVLDAIERIDLLVHDSLHTRECETWELETGIARGATVLVSDNAHATSTLEEVASRHGWTASVWRERPSRHFYPGAGIGVAQLGQVARAGGHHPPR